MAKTRNSKSCVTGANYKPCSTTAPVMSLDFWRGKRVFLTGHTGFKGSWLSLWLQSLSAELTGFSLPPPSTPSLFEQARVADGMRSIIGDIRDPLALREALASSRAEVVIHMAAQPLVRESYKNPSETYSTNVMGVVNLFEAVRASKGIRTVLNITTDKCYENREWAWGYRENEAMGGYDPYSSSKGCAELVTAAYRASFFNPSNYAEHGVAVATARAGNVIGGGDWAMDRLVPDIIKSFSLGEPALIRSPYAIRPWQHVLEPLRGYLLLSEKLYTDGPKYSEAWNFGPNDADAKPVSWIVTHLVDLWGEGGTWKIDKGPHAHEAHFLKLDISKARSSLSWEPKLSLTQALDYIVEWNKEFGKGECACDLTLRQIQRYMEL